MNKQEFLTEMEQLIPLYIEMLSQILQVMCVIDKYSIYIYTNSHTVHNVCYKNTIDENPPCFHLSNGIKDIQIFS